MTVRVGAWEELQPFMRELQSEDALLMYAA
jgi:hypothetical protein